MNLPSLLRQFSTVVASASGGPVRRTPASPLRFRRLDGAMFLLTAASAIWAQPVGPKVQSDPADSDVISLSPFSVTADRDNGYQASTSLAGSRLKTDLNDIGASISVVTRDFLRDIGATNTATLLAYTTGTEVAGLAGNMSGTTAMNQGMYTDAANINNPSPTTRLRGLAAATEARDFFNTSIPLDGYNVERIEINRGANSVLFGTGSPAGIINSSLRRAEMKNRFEVELRYGSYGAARTTFDLNRQILPGELAVRLDGLEKRAKYQQRYAYANDQRLYGTMTYAPRWARTRNGILSGTVLRAGVEVGEQDSERPRVVPPYDQISGWFQPWLGLYAPKVGWNAATMSVSQYSGGGTLASANAAARSFFQPGMAIRGPNVVFNDPASGVANTGFTVNGTAVAGMPIISSNMTNPTGTHYLVAPMDMYVAATAATGSAAVPGASYYLQHSITDPSIFDFRNQLLEGPNRLEYGSLRDKTVSLEQLFFRDRAGIELSFDRQHFTFGNSGLYFYTIALDSNTVLLDGTPNPNFGRPVAGGGWTSSYTKRQNETRRGTAFYRFNFADVVDSRLAKWLGTHSVTFLRQQEGAETQSISGPRYTMPGYIYGNNGFITDGNGAQMGTLTYLGPSLANASTPVGAHIPGLTTFQSPLSASGRNFQFRAQTVGSPFVVVPQNIVDNGLIPYDSATGASWGHTDFFTSSTVLQSKILQGLVVGTYGMRRDEVHTFTAPTPSLRGADNHLVLAPGSWDLPTRPTAISAANTATKSAVVHTPGRLLGYLPGVSRLSARYTTSENFNAGSARYDANLALIDPPSGKTKDYGFSLGLFHDRIILGVTWYQTSQVGVTAGGVASLCQTMVTNWVRLVNFANANPGFVNSANNSSTSPAVLAQLTPPPDYLLKAFGYTVTNGSAASISRGDIVLTQDYVSKGKEFEAQINLTKNWRIFLNAAEQVAVRSNTGAVFADLFFNRKFNGQTLAENWIGPAGAAAATDASGGTLANFSQSNITNVFNTQALQDGGPTQELRKWRFNAVTHYAFSKEGRLRGFGLGSGLRWQSKVAIGFPLLNSPTLGRIPDVRQPYYGPAELNVDSWIRYTRTVLRNKEISLEFRVYNVTQNNQLIPIATQPTGAVAAYRIPASRSVEFTTRLSF